MKSLYNNNNNNNYYYYYYYYFNNNVNFKNMLHANSNLQVENK